MFITGRYIPAPIPEIREEVGVEMEIIKVIALVELRVTNVGGSLAGGEVVISRRQTGRNRMTCRINCVGRREPDRRSILANEGIEENSRNQRPRDRSPDISARGVTTVYTQFIEPFINEAGIIAELADEPIVFEIEVSVHSNDVTIVILVEERPATSQFLLQPVPHGTEIIAKWVKLGRARLDQATARTSGVQAGNGERRSRQTVVLLGLGIHDTPVELESLAEDLVPARDVVHRFFHRRNSRSEGAEVEPVRIVARYGVKPAITGRRDLVVP